MLRLVTSGMQDPSLHWNSTELQGGGVGVEEVVDVEGASLNLKR